MVLIIVSKEQTLCLALPKPELLCFKGLELEGCNKEGSDLYSKEVTLFREITHSSNLVEVYKRR